MTSVEFTFLLPDGTPLANAPFEIHLSKSGFDDKNTGILMPRHLEVTTDEFGKAIVDLWPTDRVYYVVMQDPDSTAALHYKFLIQDPSIPGAVIRLQDVVIDCKMSGTTYDEAALLIIQGAKVTAIAAADKAQTVLDSLESIGTDAEAAKNAAEASALLAQRWATLPMEEVVPGEGYSAAQYAANAAASSDAATVSAQNAFTASETASQAVTDVGVYIQQAADSAAWADQSRVHAEEAARTATEESNEAVLAREGAQAARDTAALSATAAQTGATTATDAAVSAEASKANAIQSANAASQSALEATTAQGSATASASAASGSALTASTKANEATSAATDAIQAAQDAVQASNAANDSKSAAAQSESNAKTSELAAAGSAATASQAAANAASSATTAQQVAGVSGVKGATINASGDLIITRNNDSTINAGRAKGDKGERGQGITPKGTLPSEAELPPTGNQLGDSYLINQSLWIWGASGWENAGTIQGPAGNDGDAGDSAYTVAVNNGFQGTETEWLASLKGEGASTIENVAGLQTALDTKVDKVAGKQLSTEDFTTMERTKLANIAAGATVNSTDAQLRDRSTHTGTQAISTITGLQTTLNAKAAVDSPEFTGTPRAPTPAIDDSFGNVLATTQYVLDLVQQKAGLLGASTNKGVFDLNTASLGSFISVSGTGADVAANNWPTGTGLVGADPMWFNVFTFGSLARTTQIAIFTLAGSNQNRVFLRSRVDGVWNAMWARLPNQTELAAKANIDSPALSGTPTAPTAAQTTSTDQLATTAFVQAAKSELRGGVATNLNTLEKLAAALGYSENFSTNVYADLALRAPLASPALTGAPTVPTVSAGDASTKIANTAFVASEITARTGLGGTALNGTITNLDNAPLGSFLYVEGTVANISANKWPSAFGNAGDAVSFNVVTSGLASRTSQLALFAFGGINEGRMWLRKKQDLTWSNWVEVGPRAPIVTSVATATSVTPSYPQDMVTVSALSTALTIVNPVVGPATDGYSFVLRIKDDGTPRALNWGAGYTGTVAALPSVTTASKWMYFGVIYNAALGLSQVVSQVTQA